MLVGQIKVKKKKGGFFKTDEDKWLKTEYRLDLEDA